MRYIPIHVAPKHEKIDTETYTKAAIKFPELIRSKDSLEKAEKVVKAPRKPTNKKGVKNFSRLLSIKL